MKEYEVFLAVNSHSLKFKRQKGGFRKNSFLLFERLENCIHTGMQLFV